jgi:hypothetical protein
LSRCRATPFEANTSSNALHEEDRTGDADAVQTSMSARHHAKDKGIFLDRLSVPSEIVFRDRLTKTKTDPSVKSE